MKNLQFHSDLWQDSYLQPNTYLMTTGKSMNADADTGHLTLGHLGDPYDAAVIHLPHLDAMSLHAWLRKKRAAWLSEGKPLRVVVAADTHLLAETRMLSVLNKAIRMTGFELVGVMGDDAAAWSKMTGVPVIEGKPRFVGNAQALQERAAWMLRFNPMSGAEEIIQEEDTTLVNVSTVSTGGCDADVRAAETIQDELAREPEAQPISSATLLIHQDVEPKTDNEGSTDTVDVITETSSSDNTNEAISDETDESITIEQQEILTTCVPLVLAEDQYQHIETEDAPVAANFELLDFQHFLDRAKKSDENYGSNVNSTVEEPAKLTVNVGASVEGNTGNTSEEMADGTQEQVRVASDINSPNAEQTSNPTEEVSEAQPASKVSEPLAHAEIGEMEHVSSRTIVEIQDRKVEEAKPARRINGIVRSGTKIDHDGDVVIEGTVHSGAEIRATGDIHVYGVAGGRLFAGCKGDTEACLYIHKFDAEIISIANRARLFEDIPQRWQHSPVKIGLDPVNNLLKFSQLTYGTPNLIRPRIASSG